MSYGLVLFFYVGFIVVGFLLAYLYGRHTKKFLWREYIALLVAPIFGIVGLVLLLGKQPLYVFIASFFIGPFVEWIVGFAYHKIVGTHLWIYERYPFPGRYTSWLTPPMWGFGLTVI